MRFLLYKTLKDKRRLGKIAVFNCILYDASRRMANKLLFYSITRQLVNWLVISQVCRSYFQHFMLLNMHVELHDMLF